MPKRSLPRKSKALYRTLLPKLAEEPSPRAENNIGHPISPAHFELREDGTIAVEHRDEKRAPELILRDDVRGLWLYHGNCLELLDAIAAKYPEGRFDAIFADPPYFLSNGGITCHAGKMVKVDKGDWDKSRGTEFNHEFNLEWLRRCQRVLKPNGTIWVSGTHHVIFSIGYAMQQLGYKMSWTPIFRPEVGFDFGRFAVDKKEQTYESKTETTQCGLQGQSGIRSPGGAENGRAIGARVCGASGAGHAVAGDDSGSHARTL